MSLYFPPESGGSRLHGPERKVLLLGLLFAGLLVILCFLVEASK